MLHHLDQERPRNGVKSLGDINFQQYSRELPAVQPTARQLHGSEIVMDGPISDEGTLVWRDDVL